MTNFLISAFTENLICLNKHSILPLFQLQNYTLFIMLLGYTIHHRSETEKLKLQHDCSEPDLCFSVKKSLIITCISLAYMGEFQKILTCGHYFRSHCILRVLLKQTYRKEGKYHLGKLSGSYSKTQIAFQFHLLH